MTYEELKDAQFYPRRTCSICGVAIGYEIHPELAAVVFNSACGCGDGYPNYRLATHDELAELRGPDKDD